MNLWSLWISDEIENEIYGNPGVNIIKIYIPNFKITKSGVSSSGKHLRKTKIINDKPFKTEPY